MKTELNVKITTPPMRLFRVEATGRTDITEAAYAGFADRKMESIVFNVDSGEYVIADYHNVETKLTVENGAVMEQETTAPEAEPEKEEDEEALTAPEEAEPAVVEEDADEL